MNRIIGLIILFIFLFMSRQTLALVITSPNNGDTFKEGDTVKLVAELSDGDPEIFYVLFNVTKGLDHCPKKLSTHPRYVCSFMIPPGSPQTINISAIGSTVNSAVASPWISIKVLLPANVILQQLKSFTGSRLYFSGINQNNQIYLEGIYSDAVERDISTANTGTTYVSSDINVVTVDPNGLVSAKGPGKAKVTVMNGSKRLVLDAIVELKPRM